MKTKYSIILIFIILQTFVTPLSSYCQEIYYVDVNVGNGNTWPGAYEHLQDALFYAQAGDEIWVADGTYFPDLSIYNTNISLNDRTETFALVNGIIVLGGFAGGELSASLRDPKTNECILSGDINSSSFSDNSYHVIYNENISNQTILDGFTITAGYADGINTNRSGAGLFIINSSPRIINCLFNYNTSNGYGGAVFCKDQCSVLFSECTFEYNSSNVGGAVSVIGGSSTTSEFFFTRCNFENNDAMKGGGIAAIYGTSINLTDCNFTNNIATNNGGGIYVSRFANALLYSCFFSANSSVYGGAIEIVYSPSDYTLPCIIEDVTFDQNIASGSGGALYAGHRFNYTQVESCIFKYNISQSQNGGGALCSTGIDFINCIFNQNAASLYGGGICVCYVEDPKYTKILNCTFYNNTASDGEGIAGSNWGLSGPSFENVILENTILWDQGVNDEIWTEDGSTMDVSNSDVKGGYPGTQNINEDPMFMGTLSDDFHLMSVSPCIDAGENNIPNLPMNDYEDDLRIINQIVDIGADERNNSGVIYVDADCTHHNPNGSSWTRAFPDLQMALDIASNDNEIWVAEGYYYPSEVSLDASTDTPENNVFQLFDGFALYGGFEGVEEERHERDWEAHPTILSGDINGTSNCYHVLLASYLDEYPVIVDGFIIEEANDDADHQVAGILISSSDAKVSNCIFRNNGGGLITNIGSNTIIQNCIFINNVFSSSGCGGVQNFNCYLVANYCSFIENINFIGGAFFHHSEGLNPGTSYINNCVFSQNQATMTGGAIYAQCVQSEEIVFINNCSFSNNICPPNAEGRTVTTWYSGITSIENSIIWSDDSYTNSHVHNGLSAMTLINYSDIRGGWLAGIGNMNTPPRFHNPANHDLHLKSTVGRWDPSIPPNGGWTTDGINSDCIDEGDPLIQPIPFIELPPHGDVINMGAFGNTWEASKSPSKTEDYKTFNIYPNSQAFDADLQISPNPFSTISKIYLTISGPSKVSLKVYDVNGRLTQNIFSGYLPKGKHKYILGGDSNLQTFAKDGIYFVVALINEEKIVNKVVLER